jgi:hypothetical protein
MKFAIGVILVGLIVISAQAEQDHVNKFRIWLEQLQNAPIEKFSLEWGESRIVSKATQAIQKGEILYRLKAEHSLVVPYDDLLIKAAEEIIGTRLYSDQQVFLLLLSAKANRALLPEWNTWLGMRSRAQRGGSYLNSSVLISSVIRCFANRIFYTFVLE